MFVFFRWIIPVVAVGTFILVTFLTMHIIQYTKYRVTQKSVITDQQQTSDKNQVSISSIFNLNCYSRVYQTEVNMVVPISLLHTKKQIITQSTQSYGRLNFRFWGVVMVITNAWTSAVVPFEVREDNSELEPKWRELKPVNTIKQKVVIAVVCHAEFKSSLYFGLTLILHRVLTIFRPMTWRLLQVSYKTPVF